MFKAGHKPFRKPQEKSSTTDLSVLQAEDLKKVRRYLPSAEKVFLKAYLRKSMAAAVKAKCIECCCLQKSEVTLCTIEGCPLWRYRPYQKKGENEQPVTSVTSRNAE